MKNSILYKSCICLIYKSDYIYILDTTKNSSKVVTETSVNNELTEINLKPDDFQESIVNISEQTEATSDNSELSQTIVNSCKSNTGKNKIVSKNTYDSINLKKTLN